MIPGDIWYEIFRKYLNPNGYNWTDCLFINKRIRNIIINHEMVLEVRWKSKYKALYGITPIKNPKSWLFLCIHAKLKTCIYCHSIAYIHHIWKINLCLKCSNRSRYKTITQDMARSFFYLKPTEYFSLKNHGAVLWQDALEYGYHQYSKLINERKRRFNLISNQDNSSTT